MTAFFPQRIKMLREMRGITQKKLADNAGVHEMTVQFYEYGRRKPQPGQLSKLAEALNVDIAYLQPVELSTRFSLLALLFDFVEEFGDVRIEQCEGNTLFGVGPEHKHENEILTAAFYAHETLSPEEFKKWLVNYTGKR